MSRLLSAWQTTQIPYIPCKLGPGLAMREQALAEIWLFSGASRNAVACTCGDCIVSLGVSCPKQQEGKGKFMPVGEKSCKLQDYRAVSEAKFKSWGVDSLVTGQ